MSRSLSINGYIEYTTSAGDTFDAIVSLFIQSLDRKLSLQQQKIWRRADTVFSRRTACRNSVEFSETIWLRRAARRKFSVNMAEGAVFYVNCGEKAVYTPVYRRYV